ncbi:TonB-dependent receptor [Candidatus Entotheonella serta]|nr:TonB-dependent receptor [Candidatus Entotheonella serta]
MVRNTSRNRGAPLWLLCIPLWLFASIATLPIASGQESEGDALPPIVVTAPRVETSITDVPAAISVVGTEDIQLGQPTLGLDESLARIPGTFSQNRFNFAQDLRVSIRGFGARAAFGIRGIKILVDGIPATLPDGQSQVDSLDLGSAERVEVMRGPASALYGNASGGVISVTTEDGPETPFVEGRITLGEYDLWKLQLKSGGQAGPMNYLISASRLEYGGYREQSDTESVVFNSKFRFDIDESSDLTAVINIVDSPRADDPGGLSRANVEENRRAAAAVNLSNNTGEEVSQQRFGLVYRRDFGDLHELQINGYITARQFRGAIPFRVIEFDRYFGGGGLQYSYHGDLFGRSSWLTVGIDVQHQSDRRQNFNNVNGEPGETLRLNQDERVTSVGPYIQEELDLLDQLTLVLGGRYDYVRFKVDDFLTSNGDDTGSRTFDQVTGRFGLIYRPSPTINAYINISQSFETPSTTELVNRPDDLGGLNPDIEPQKAVNYEIGVKGQAFKRLRYEFALFYIDLEDELISFEENGRTFFRNAGESRRYGVELGLGLQVFDGLRSSFAYTYLNAEFDEFLKEGVELGGNEVPGLPPHQVHGELFYQHASGLYGGIDILYVSEFFVTDENDEQNDAYTVANVRLGYEYLWENWLFAPFLGVQNLFDEKYNSNVRINAFGGRFFEPAPELNVYGGINVAYHW